MIFSHILIEIHKTLKFYTKLNLFKNEYENIMMM